MGDPRRIKSKYAGPRHPWIKTRIEEEKLLLKEYGLKNKKEIYKINSKLKNFTKQAKRLIAEKGKQAELEKTQLIGRLNRLGLVVTAAQLEDILSLTLKDFLNRRLQTIVHKKGYARTIKQARQFITHGHITVKNKPLTIPSYLVTVAEEPAIEFLEKSSLFSPEHPERKFEKIKTGEKPKKAPPKYQRRNRRQGRR